MTLTDKLTTELNELNKARLEVIKANTVECNAPTCSKSFTYYKSPVIKASSIAEI